MTTLGVLYPGFAAEADYVAGGRLARPPVAVVVAHTAVAENTNTVEDARRTGEIGRLLDGLHDLRTRCAALHVRTDAVLWACTAGSFVFGLDGAREQSRRLSAAAGVPATSTSLAFAEAVGALGLRRVAVAATYPSEEAALFGAFLGEVGVEVLGIDAAGIADGSGGALLDEDQVIAFATGADLPGADAILVPDTAVATLSFLDRLEAAAGKPVLTANQVTLWQGLRLAGAYRSQDGMGSLFRSAPAAAGRVAPA
jgi:maleate cis-trans isomerase